MTARRRSVAWGSWFVRVGGLLYTNWVLQLVLPVSHDVLDSPVSSLSAPGQPLALLFRTLDATSGALLVVGALLVLRARAPRTRLLYGVALLGTTNVALALLPEECGDPGAVGPAPCSDERLLTDPHTALSLVQDLTVVGLALGALLVMRKARSDRLVQVLSVVAIATWAVAWPTGGGSFLGGPLDGYAAFQRAFVVATSLWLVVALPRVGRKR